MSDQEIIKAFHNKMDEISEKSMVKILVERSLKSFDYVANLVGYVPNRKPSKRIYTYKFSNEQIQKALKLRSEGYSYGAIQGITGVTYSALKTKLPTLVQTA